MKDCRILLVFERSQKSQWSEAKIDFCSEKTLEIPIRNPVAKAFLHTFFDTKKYEPIAQWLERRYDQYTSDYVGATHL